MDDATGAGPFGGLEYARREPCQLYLVSPPTIPPGFEDVLRDVFDTASIAAFQFRVKSGADEHELARLAEPLLRLCAERDVAFIVNDSAALAKRVGADGVHLGQHDGDPRGARDLLGREAQIGVTCHDSRHLAMEAGEAGADYVAFGAFFPSDTKQSQHTASLDILRWWATLSPIPCVAIGGLTTGNVAPVIAAGADFIAVSGAVWNDPDGPAAGAARFSSILAAGDRPPA